MNWQEDIKQIQAQQPKHVLFMCVQNSARSQLAEGIARSLAPAGVQVSSAGSKPAFVRPQAIEVLREIDIDASTHSSKTVADIDASTVDVVITLCAEEVCPVFPRRVAKYHWPLTDPAKAGTLDAFRATRDELLARLKTLFKSG
ncbi:MAG: arsenate reductase ArsC [Planctomycetes bacterium]|nr:arsenate reductase ArsC [Planctomycetota bacterium]